MRSDRYFLPKVSSSVFSASDKFGQRSNFVEDDLDEDEDESDDEGGEEDDCGGGAFLAVIFCSCFSVMIVAMVVRALESIDCIC